MRSRNIRLAAVRSFLKFAARRDPVHLGTLGEDYHGGNNVAYVFTGLIDGKPRPDMREIVEARITSATVEALGGSFADVVRTRMYIGSQYAWLPMFCKQQGVDGIEMSVHVDDKVQALLSSRVVAFEQAGTYRSVRVAPAANVPILQTISLPLSSHAASPPA